MQQGMRNRSDRRWNGMAALGLALSMAGYLIVQGGAMPNKNKTTQPVIKEITLKSTES
ncbi:hypothetical protein [Synechococcus sp. LA31]|uniref:hypothetical protein n=1 Tax=Synechococcus sp. LA31 TaxID=2741953 RepID=UPI001BDBC428|nr:hypothetical protein [Synechococcus sp. LA31]QVV67208.1 hypothetical protein KJJ24_12310 [Synechococcus sp. LA31]